MACKAQGKGTIEPELAKGGGDKSPNGCSLYMLPINKAQIIAKSMSEFHVTPPWGSGCTYAARDT